MPKIRLDVLEMLSAQPHGEPRNQMAQAIRPDISPVPVERMTDRVTEVSAGFAYDLWFVAALVAVVVIGYLILLVLGQE